MSRLKRALSRIFKERQIYHRSDNVVHFISMSTETQVSLAVVIGAALLWISYASVNVAFKEQIVVALNRQHRVETRLYSDALLEWQSAYDKLQTDRLVLAENLVRFCTKHNCEPGEVTELLAVRPNAKVVVRCDVRGDFKVECNSLKIVRVREKRPIHLIITRFVEERFKWAMITVGEIMGMSGDSDDPEFIRDLRIRLMQVWLPSMVGGALTALLFVLGMIIRRQDRPATKAELEKLASEIREQLERSSTN